MAQTLLPALADNRKSHLEHPLFHCAWDRAVFLHYRVAPHFLAPAVPFELDLFHGQAYVSLVAFTLRNMRLEHPRLKFITQPLHTHRFLNVRTYVRVGEHRGIYFLAEWLNNRLATMLGPVLYGLPYRFGKLKYSHTTRLLCGEVLGRIGALRYTASLPLSLTPQPAKPGSLDHFLLERYTAFTKHGPFRRLFHVWHNPWLQISIDPQIESDSLLHQTGPWFAHSQLIDANFSPGLSDVQMGWPQSI